MKQEKNVITILESTSSIDVIDYDLNPEGIQDHDALATAQAGKLTELGYLEYETDIYGCAYYKDGERHYYLARYEDTMHKFMTQCYQDNIWPTPAQYFSKRYDLVNDTEEDIKNRFRLGVAQQLQESYPMIYFEAMQALTSQNSLNAGYDILFELCKQLESCFDLNQLNLMRGLMEMMYRRRLLNKEGLTLISQWLQKEYEKISVEPTASGYYKKTYSGFAYQKDDGPIKYFTDAFSYMAIEKQAMFTAQGYTVSPIMTCTYYGDSYNALMNVGKQFKEELRSYLNDMYMKLLHLIDTLPSGVSQETYDVYLEKIKATGSKKAVDAFLYYGHLWNVVK